jgi:hypothetical protein
MPLSKIETVDLIEVVESGCIQVRTATRILDNDVVISSAFHRHVVAPGNDYSAEDAKVQTICAALHTPEIIAAYQAEQARIISETASQL